MRRLILIPALALLTTSFMDTAPAHAEAIEAKLGHYCSNWGAAGLFPDDMARLQENPLATLDIGEAKILLLYINRGHELDEQPKEWAEVWSAFDSACPGQSKPAWLLKLEQWKADQLRKQDPIAAQQMEKIKSLRLAAKARDAEAKRLRADIQTSSAYVKITGGSTDWFKEAKAKSDQLRKIVALGSTRYTVIGRLRSRGKNTVTLEGIAIAPEAIGATGTRLSMTSIIIENPASESSRADGNFYAEDLYQAGFINAKNPVLRFTPTLNRPIKAQVSSARSELRKVENVLRSGRNKLANLMRPVTKLEALAKRLRDQADALEAKMRGTSK